MWLVSVQTRQAHSGIYEESCYQALCQTCWTHCVLGKVSYHSPQLQANELYIKSRIEFWDDDLKGGKQQKHCKIALLLKCLQSSWWHSLCISSDCTMNWWHANRHRGFFSIFVSADKLFMAKNGAFVDTPVVLLHGVTRVGFPVQWRFLWTPVTILYQ